MNSLFIKNLWRWKCGLPEDLIKSEIVSYDDLSKTEWSDEFEGLMKNRLILGALRYGRLKAENKPQYGRIESAFKRLKRYQKTGNKEFLVDVANLMLLEFEECQHPLEHFSSIDDGDHVKIK
jgi:hypothetical protein